MKALQFVYFRSSLYFNIVFFWILISTGLILLFPPLDIIKFFNRILHGHPDIQLIIYFITNIAEGIPFIIILIFLLIKENGKIKALYIALTMLITFAFVQISKQFLFQDFYRPMYYILQNPGDFHPLTWMRYHHHFSFPSGHSAAGFALFTSLALLFPRKSISLICAVIAVLIALSRVMLAQHFYHDVLVGAILGMGIAIFLFILFYKKYPSAL
jgi:membrane-associated phospholipid phosphatase